MKLQAMRNSGEIYIKMVIKSFQSMLLREIKPICRQELSL